MASSRCYVGVSGSPSPISIPNTTSLRSQTYSCGFSPDRGDSRDLAGYRVRVQGCGSACRPRGSRTLKLQRNRTVLSSMEGGLQSGHDVSVGASPFGQTLSTRPVLL